MMAGYGLKGFGWFLCGVVVAPACYMVTSQVAAERAQLAAMDRAIVQAHKDIRSLETEFNTRASMAQIEHWNGDFLELASPEPGQYLGDESQLASLSPTMDGGMQQASLIVPKGGSQGVAVQTSAEDAAPVATASADTSAPRSGVASTSHARGGDEVAMLDERLLSTSTVDDLRQRANIERLALR
ncbi:hypothetical protein [Stakelama tenebrarum]|uniref:Uncharacterized protein n=1 Tax=Stakelama tenebrarum TaxID=2711215 RepID=A0A6G6Y4M7_9SPHN|nr:hypothetical protein [Sphingosinithalassobacter tenebrarum]QIG79801.1 hypothetical protein G5C33_08380 [Sphingosinithalassobacter tenebrarum]